MRYILIVMKPMSSIKSCNCDKIIVRCMSLYKVFSHLTGVENVLLIVSIMSICSKIRTVCVLFLEI